MSDSQQHHDHDPIPPAAEPPAPMLDAGSRALEEAFRSSFIVVKVVMVLLLVVFVFSGVKTVGPQEKAVILRFGKPLGTGPEQLLGPGLHWALPYPIDEVVVIPVGQFQTVVSTVGWYATTAVQEAAGTEPPPGPSLNPAADGYALTADGNIIHARATLRYRITDPLAYSFSFVNASNTVLDALNRALVHAAAHSTVDEALLNNAGFREKVLASVNEQVDALKLGITIDPSDVTVIPPRFVKQNFDAVLNAEQDRSKVVLTAQSYTSQLPQYRFNPGLLKQRLLAETWQRILAGSSDKFVLPERADGKSRELRLLLNREPPKPRTEAPAHP